MSDLADFLTARISEDEERAHGRRRIDPRQPTPFPEGVAFVGDGRFMTRRGGEQVDVTDEYNRWVATLEPVVDPREVAECDAKRRIVADLPHARRVWQDEQGREWSTCPLHYSDNGCAGYEEHLTLTLRSLAAIYSGHPDYRKEWAEEWNPE
jgi:hypothetical protein